MGRLSAAGVTVSDALAAKYAPFIPASKLRTAHQSVTIPTGRAAEWPDGRCCLWRLRLRRGGCFASLSSFEAKETKGQADAVRAIAELVSQGIHAELLVIGDLTRPYGRDLHAIAHIIADEAQDFTAEWWVPLLELREPGRYLYFFLDDNQSIYASRPEELPVHEPPFWLPGDIRFTRKIHEVVLHFYRGEMEPEPPPLEGEAPDIRPGVGVRQEPRLLQTVLREVLGGGEGGSPGRGGAHTCWARAVGASGRHAAGQLRTDVAGGAGTDGGPVRPGLHHPSVQGVGASNGDPERVAFASCDSCGRCLSPARRGWW